VNLLEKQLSTVYFNDVRFPWVTLYNYNYNYLILRCAIPVVCLNYMVSYKFGQNTTINVWLNDGVY